MSTLYPLSHLPLPMFRYVRAHACTHTHKTCTHAGAHCSAPFHKHLWALCGSVLCCHRKHRHERNRISALYVRKHIVSWGKGTGSSNPAQHPKAIILPSHKSVNLPSVPPSPPFVFPTLTPDLCLPSPLPSQTPTNQPQLSFTFLGLLFWYIHPGLTHKHLGIMCTCPLPQSPGYLILLCCWTE
jgi:hypothetical protein